MSYVFEVTAEELAKISEWSAKQDEAWIAKHGEHPMGGPNYGAIGGQLTYCFTPTSLGVATKVKHANGEELDVTNYSEW